MRFTDAYSSPAEAKGYYAGIITRWLGTPSRSPLHQSHICSGLVIHNDFDIGGTLSCQNEPLAGGHIEATCYNCPVYCHISQLMRCTKCSVNLVIEGAFKKALNVILAFLLYLDPMRQRWRLSRCQTMVVVSKCMNATSMKLVWSGTEPRQFSPSGIGLKLCIIHHHYIFFLLSQTWPKIYSSIPFPDLISLSGNVTRSFKTELEESQLCQYVGQMPVNVIPVPCVDTQISPSQFHMFE